MLKCRLRDMPSRGTTEVRQGRYHGSNFWDVGGFGKNKWVIGAYIDFNYTDVPPWMGEGEIIKGCIEYLNEPPPRRKYEKKASSSLYGSLDVYQYRFKKGGENTSYIEVMLITDQRRNKHFWGKGKSDKF